MFHRLSVNWPWPKPRNLTVLHYDVSGSSADMRTTSASISYWRFMLAGNRKDNGGCSKAMGVHITGISKPSTRIAGESQAQGKKKGRVKGRRCVHSQI
jgi:hypothetical protein